MERRQGGWADQGPARPRYHTSQLSSSSPPESNTMTRRRARPSMSAADRPAGPPPARVEGCSGGCGAVAGKLARRRRGGPKGRASASRPPAQAARSPAALQAGRTHDAAVPELLLLGGLGQRQAPAGRGGGGGDRRGLLDADGWHRAGAADGLMAAEQQARPGFRPSLGGRRRGARRRCTRPSLARVACAAASLRLHATVCW